MLKILKKLPIRNPLKTVKCQYHVLFMFLYSIGRALLRIVIFCKQRFIIAHKIQIKRHLPNQWPAKSCDLLVVNLFFFFILAKTLSKTIQIYRTFYTLLERAELKRHKYFKRFQPFRGITEISKFTTCRVIDSPGSFGIPFFLCHGLSSFTNII